MKRFTVRQLARLSGVSVRTLHHYDARGLLKPAHVGGNRYRYYGEPQLLRLQQILLYRSLGLSLHDIGALLDADAGSRLMALRRQREAIAATLANQQRILATLDRTITWLEGGQDMKEEDLFDGLTSPQQAAYEDWLIQRGGVPMGEALDESRRHLTARGRDALQSGVAELEDVESQLAARCAAGVEAGSPDLAPLLARHRAWVASMWGRDCPIAAYAGLADLYLAHPDFEARFEARLAGFADWLASAMKQYAERMPA
jgi:DNA-binding transcriptional MerR regulator